MSIGPTIGSAVIRVTASGAAFATSVRQAVRDGGPGARKEAATLGKAISGALAGPLGKIAALPFLTSGIGALGGVITALSGTLLQASGSALSIIGVLGGLITAGGAAALAFSGLGDAIGGDEEALAKLTPEAQKAVGAIRGLKDEANALKRSVQAAVFKDLSDDISKLGQTFLPILQNRLTQTGGILNRMFQNLTRFATSEGYVKKFDRALAGNNRTFGILSKAAVPLLKGITNLYIALQPYAARLAQQILKGARAFAGFADSKRDVASIRDFMERAFNSTRLLWRMVKNLGAALGNVLGIASKEGDGLVKTLGDLSIRFRNFTESAEGQNSIAKWIEVSVQSFRTLGRIIGAMGGILGAAFNPGLFNSLVSVIEGLIPTIQTIFGVLQNALAPIIAQLEPAFKTLGPLISELGEALAPLLKGIGDVIGEVIKQAVPVIAGFLKILIPVVRFLAEKLGSFLSTFKEPIAFIILAFTNLGGTLIRIGGVMGRVAGPIVVALGAIIRVASAIFKAFSPISRLIVGIFAGAFDWFKPIIDAAKYIYDVLFGNSIFPDIQDALVLFVKAMKLYVTLWITVFKTAFNIIKTVVTAVFKVISTVFNGIKTVVVAVIGAILPPVRTAFNSIRTIIVSAVSIAGTIFRTYFNIMRTVATTVFRVIATVVRTQINIVKTVITTVLKVIKAIFSGNFGAIPGIVSGAFDKVKSAVSGALGKIKDLVGDAVGDVIGKIRELPGKLGGLASDMLGAGRRIGEGILNGISSALNAAGNLLSNIASSIKNGVNSILGLPKYIGFKILGKSVGFTIPGFAKGTSFAPGGPALVGERGPELVNLPRGARVTPASRTAAMARDLGAAAMRRSGSTLPSTVILRVGDRRFTAFVEEIADGRIDAAESLAYQGT